MASNEPQESTVKTPVEKKETEPKRTRRGCGTLPVILVLLLMVGGYFLPAIVAGVITNRDAMAWISQRFDTNLQVGKVSLGWQSPVLVNDLVVKTKEGAPVATVKSVTSHRTLWSMLTQSQDILQLSLDGVSVTVVVPDPEVSDEKMNVTQFVEQVHSWQMPTPARLMQIKVTGAQIDFVNEQQQPLDRWENVAAEYEYLNQDGRQQKLAMVLPSGVEDEAETLTVQLQWKEEPVVEDGESLLLSCLSNGLSLAAADGWLREYLGENHGLSHCSGTLQGEFHREQAAGWAVQLSSDLKTPEGLTIPVGNLAGQGAPSVNHVQMQLASRYLRPEKQLLLSDVQLSAQGVAVSLQGDVSDLSGSEIINLTGELYSPGLSLTEWLPSPLNEEVQIQGARFSEISVRGPLQQPEEALGNPFEFGTLIEWQAASAYGINSDGGRLRLVYQNNVLKSDPIDVRLNGGRLVQLPDLRFQGETRILDFREGNILENVVLSEEVCREWMRFISPTLANSTTADGRFSLSTQAGSIPLGHPELGALEGALTVHHAEVRPGPMAAPILERVEQFRGILKRGPGDAGDQVLFSIDPQTVPFRLHQGRVYHQNFVSRVREMQLATSGSVGLDETLDLQIRMLAPEAWVANAGPVLAAILDEPIVLGVSGTLNEPKVDASSLADFGKRAGIKAGTGLLQDLIERRINRGR